MEICRFPFSVVPRDTTSCGEFTRPPFGTFGVGQFRTASVSIVPECITPVVVVCLAAERESATVAVGQDEDAFAFVRRADFLRREETCLNAEAHALQLRSDDAKSRSGVPCDILEKAPIGLNFANDPSNICPEPSVICCAFSLAGDGVGLAGITANDAANAAMKGPAVEGR